jgi:phage anti-repressor protein
MEVFGSVGGEVKKMAYELIPINYEGKNPTVNGRELHAFLEVETRYDMWFKRMCDYGFRDDKDFCTFLCESTGGRPAEDHALTISMAKEICMLQRSSIGKRLSGYCRSHAVEIRKCKTNDERFGDVNSYPITVWNEYLERQL